MKEKLTKTERAFLKACKQDPVKCEIARANRRKDPRNCLMFNLNTGEISPPPKALRVVK